MPFTDAYKSPVYHHANLLIGVICAIIYAGVAIAVIGHNIDRIEGELTRNIEKVHHNLTEKFNVNTNVLDGFNAYFRTVDNTDFKSFDEYSSSIMNQYPHIHMTHYMVLVSRNDRESFVSDRKNEGYYNYEIKKHDTLNPDVLIPMEESDIYYPFVFISPLTVSSSKYLGYDAYSSPVIRDAIDKSISVGSSFSTTSFSSIVNKDSYMIIRPIFTKEEVTDDATQRKDSATRLVGITIKTEDLINDINISNVYTIKLTLQNSPYTTSKDIEDNIPNEKEYFFFPLIKKNTTLKSSGQTFRLNVQRQIYWQDLDHGWISFYLIITLAVLILLFSFIRLRMQSNIDRQQAQMELYKERELAEVTLYSIDEAVITTDIDQTIKFMNPVACLLTGWSIKDAVGKPLDQVYKIYDEHTREPIINTLSRCLDLQCTVRSESPAILIKNNGGEYIIESSSAIIRDHNYATIGAVLVFRNITNVRDMSKKMEFQATHDALTELINRREFEQKLKQAIQSANDDKHTHALCYMDLDQFKIVNDTCGHIAGDQLLRELSKLMPHSIRASDCLARLGGDEFGVLMFDCPIHQAKTIAESLRSTIKDFTFKWDKKIFDVGVSIGLVPIHKNCGSLQQIMSRADSACYIAKDMGRNRIHVYTDDDKAIAHRQGEMMWLSEIQSALKDERFKLYIQKILPVKNSTDLTHYEILLRMEDKNGTIIPPMSFLPAADRYDIMPKIDKWVIEASFTKISHEIKHTKNRIYNINLSGQTLHDKGIIDFIKNKIQQLNIPPEIICFEITETAVISNFTTAINLIHTLKEFGCKFALDDFGSGLSSFSYLKKLPVDYLKIDGEFVRDILYDQMDRAILTSICSIGHEMGLKTVAEYVESTGILAACVEIGVDYAQGYAIEKPYSWTPEKIIPIKTRSIPNA